MATVDQPIVPGPCGPGGCPPPTEIECIEVFKVYDLCFQPETFNRSFTITSNTVIACLCPATGMVRETDVCPLGTPIPCRLGPVTCTELSRTPTGTDGFASITLSISVPVALFPVGTTNFVTTTPCVTQTAVFTKRVTLCAPTGTDVICTVTGDCDCMIAAEDVAGTSGNITSLTIECALNLCVVVKTVAEVNLLVPAYGFCVPAECTTMGLTCPPGPPPQCIVTPPPPTPPTKIWLGLMPVT